MVGTEPPPSLEALQATRPGDEKGNGLEPGRAEMVRTAALTYGAQGGLAARSFALNEMLRRYQAQLDSAYDFHTLVLPVGSGQTLMRPPIVSAAQMAFALGEGGQVARETSCIYQITREAQLASTPPNWRAYLVRIWAAPRRPTDGVLPRTRQEVAYWNKWVAEGLGAGREAGRRDLPLRSRPPRARHRRHGPLSRAAARRAGRAAQARVPEACRSMAAATGCMSATRPSASPISRACRATRAGGGRARGARNEQVVHPTLAGVVGPRSCQCLIAPRLLRKPACEPEHAWPDDGLRWVAEPRTLRARARLAADLGVPARKPRASPSRPGIRSGSASTAATTASRAAPVDEDEFAPDRQPPLRRRRHGAAAGRQRLRHRLRDPDRPLDAPALPAQRHADAHLAARRRQHRAAADRRHAALARGAARRSQASSMRIGRARAW